MRKLLYVLAVGVLLLSGCIGTQTGETKATTTLKPAAEPATTSTTTTTVKAGTRVPTSAPASTATSTTAAVPTTMPDSAAASVIIKDFAFNPPEITVKAGTTVTWVNEDSAPHKVASDPHPTHTDLPGLVSGVLSTGESYSFTFTKKGTFGYHCHIHPSMKGTVVVE